MHPILSIAFVVLGVLGFAATAYLAKRGMPGYYSFGSEVILYGFLIAAGIGLYRGKAFGRVLALALLRAGAWAIVLVPIGLVLWLANLQQGAGSILQVMGALFFAVVLLAAGPGGRTETSPLLYVGGALVLLAALSFVCSRAYRRLRSSHEATSEDEHVRVNLLVVALVATAFAAHHRLRVSDYDLPTAVRSAETKEQSKKWADQALAELVGTPMAVEGGKGLVYFISRYEPSLVHVDVASGKAERKQLPQYALQISPQSGQRIVSWFSPDTSLFWANSLREFIDFHTGRRVKPGISQDWDRYHAIGFVDGSKRFLLFDTVETRVVALDTTSALPVFSADVTPPGGFSSDQYRLEFRHRIVGNSVFSADRARLAWFYLDTLYAMDTATGALISIPVPSPRDTLMYHSRDGNRVFTMTPYDQRAGSLVDVAAKSRVEHQIHGVDLLHFSGGEGVIVHLPRADYKAPPAFTLARWNLANLATPVWKIGFDHWHARVSADGKRLYVYNPGEHRLETADLAGLAGNTQPTFTPLAVTLPPGQVKWLSYFPEGNVLVAVQSPKMAIVRLDASGGVAGSYIVDFTAFSAAPK